MLDENVVSNSNYFENKRIKIEYFDCKENIIYTLFNERPPVIKSFVVSSRKNARGKLIIRYNYLTYWLQTEYKDIFITIHRRTKKLVISTQTVSYDKRIEIIDLTKISFALWKEIYQRIKQDIYIILNFGEYDVRNTWPLNLRDILGS